jgi:hypothetical protein
MGSDDDAIMREVTALHDREPHQGLSGERLRLHIAIHTVVETQLRDGTPPEATATLARLQAEGLDRHEATHAIGAAVGEELYEVMSEKRRYDEARYVSRLRAITATGWREYLESIESPDEDSGGRS